MRIDHKILLAALKHPAAGMRHHDIDRAELAIVGRIRPPAGWIPADAADIEWARKHGIPDALIKVFEDGWPTASTEIGPWARVWDLASICEEMEEYPAYFEHGFLLLGSTLCGDKIMVDLRHHPGAIGYVEFGKSLDKSANIRSYSSRFRRRLARSCLVWSRMRFPSMHSPAGLTRMRTHHGSRTPKEAAAMLADERQRIVDGAEAVGFLVHIKPPQRHEEPRTHAVGVVKWRR